MSPVVAAEHGRAAPPTCCFSCWPARLAHLTCQREDLGIHSFHWACPFWLGKAIWIPFKRLFILEKEDRASRACWWKVGLGDAADDRPAQCPEWSAAVSEACVKSPLQTWVLKLLLLGSWVHQSPRKCWHCSVVGRCLTGSACLGSQANVQWSWKEKRTRDRVLHPPHSVAISAFAETHSGRQAPFLYLGSPKVPSDQPHSQWISSN